MNKLFINSYVTGFGDGNALRYKYRLFSTGFC